MMLPFSPRVSHTCNLLNLCIFICNLICTSICKYIYICTCISFSFIFSFAFADTFAFTFIYMHSYRHLREEKVKCCKYNRIGGQYFRSQSSRIGRNCMLLEFDIAHRPLHGHWTLYMGSYCTRAQIARAHIAHRLTLDKPTLHTGIAWILHTGSHCTWSRIAQANIAHRHCMDIAHWLADSSTSRNLPT